MGADEGRLEVIEAETTSQALQLLGHRKASSWICGGVNPIDPRLWHGIICRREHGKSKTGNRYVGSSRHPTDLLEGDGCTTKPLLLCGGGKLLSLLKAGVLERSSLSDSSVFVRLRKLLRIMTATYWRQKPIEICNSKQSITLAQCDAS